MAGMIGCLMKMWPGTRWGRPSMPIPEWAGSMDNMTSVSINNGREHPTIGPVSLGFSMVILVMFSGTKIPGKYQPLATRLRRSKRFLWEERLWGTDLLWQCKEVQSILQFLSTVWARSWRQVKSGAAFPPMTQSCHIWSKLQVESVSTPSFLAVASGLMPELVFLPIVENPFHAFLFLPYIKCLIHQISLRDLRAIV